jgi:hypothetical protein
MTRGASLGQSPLPKNPARYLKRLFPAALFLENDW